MVTRNGIIVLVLLLSLLSLPPHEIQLGNILFRQKDGFRDSVTFFKSYLVCVHNSLYTCTHTLFLGCWFCSIFPLLYTIVPHLWSTKIFISLRIFDWPLYENTCFANKRYRTDFTISPVAFLEAVTTQDKDSLMIMLTFKSTTELSKDNLQTLLQWLINCTFSQKYLMYCFTHQSLLLYSQRLFGIYLSPQGWGSLLLSKIQPGGQWNCTRNMKCFDS